MYILRFKSKTNTSRFHVNIFFIQVDENSQSKFDTKIPKFYLKKTYKGGGDII